MADTSNGTEKIIPQLNFNSMRRAFGNFPNLECTLFPDLEENCFTEVNAVSGVVKTIQLTITYFATLTIFTRFMQIGHLLCTCSMSQFNTND